MVWILCFYVKRIGKNQAKNEIFLPGQEFFKYAVFS